ncbi:glycosyltransferase [Parapedobacter indicus]|uniref:Glycosyl transferases group 1 n=1 Tax=Parapedobacter indicus TaxID=1477437 RepID=A0A1I3USC9_9SPHI|nr:glycosyltransferase [Parapedobacter indicus]PPK99105.1 glycosyl transferase family 1 [Parapedobacter indicus]SFJ85850.1 Glycosyl transferases group 1 [Parapedobacter indicus]
MNASSSRLRIFTWHIHGSYLYYLSQGNYDLYIPVNKERSEGYYGRGTTFPFGPNVHEVDADSVQQLDFDLILFQTTHNYQRDQYEVLSPRQRDLPKIYLQHDPPWGHPTDTVHIACGSDVTLVHVTYFNKLMWDNGQLDTRVIEHGVVDRGYTYTGELGKGLVIINNLPQRGRMLGFDLFLELREHIPLDLVGMETGPYGLSEVLHPELPAFAGKYRFLFNPIRYTSMGLAVCEAMTYGMPIIGLATTEMVRHIRDGFNGFLDLDPKCLIDKMMFLLENRDLATSMGTNARRYALERFGIRRFVQEWEKLFNQAVERQPLTSLYSD